MAFICGNVAISLNDLDFYSQDVLSHHGVKGQRWGVRRYQNKDGSLTDQGRRHWGVGYGDDAVAKDSNKGNSILSSLKRSGFLSTKLSDLRDKDTVIKAGTNFSRIQSMDTFESYPFYATYKKCDVKRYTGLFGHDLIRRAKGAAERALLDSDKDPENEELRNKAKAAKETYENLKIYKVQIGTKKDINIPSQKNLNETTHELLKDKDFVENLKKSVDDCEAGMLRPQHKIIISKAKRILTNHKAIRDPKNSNDIYKALNLSLTYHNKHELDLQDKFYGSLKKQGYDAIVDLNDQKYSSYHARRPMIVFNTSKVEMKACSQMSDKDISRLYKVENVKRMAQEIPLQALTALTSYGMATTHDAISYVESKTSKYLSSAENVGR